MTKAFTLIDHHTDSLPEQLQDKKIDLEERPFWTVEANLATIPWVGFGRNVKQATDSEILYQYTNVLDNTLIKSTVCVSMSSFGENGKLERETLPMQFDHDVFLCVMDLWDQQGKRDDGYIRFKILDLTNRLMISKCGKTYEMVKRSLKRLARLNIESRQAFYSAVVCKRIDEKFHLFEVRLNGYKTKGKGKAKVKEEKDQVNGEDEVEIYLSKIILENLKRNHTTKLNRIIYQQLENGFSKRIFNLIAHKEQIDGERRYFDFNLFYLAEVLPIKGAEHISAIKQRLNLSLKELKDANLFNFEYVKNEKSEILRLIPIMQDTDYVGREAVKRFLGTFYEVYRKKLTDVVDLTEGDIIDFVKNDKFPPIVVSEVSYSSVLYKLHIVAHQIFKGWKPKLSLHAVIKTMLSKEIYERPVGFKHLHRLKLELVKKAEVNPETTYSNLPEEVVRNAIDKKADEYLFKLSVTQLEAYIKEVKKSSPICNDFVLDGFASRFFCSSITSLIKRDIEREQVISLRDAAEDVAWNNLNQILAERALSYCKELKIKDTDLQTNFPAKLKLVRLLARDIRSGKIKSEDSQKEPPQIQSPTTNSESPLQLP